MCAEAVPSTFSAHSSSAIETAAPDLHLSDLVGKHRGAHDSPTTMPAESAQGIELAGVTEKRGARINIGAGAGTLLLAPESVSAGGLGSSGIREQGGGEDLSNSKSSLHHLDAVKRLNAMLLQLDRKDRDVLKLRASQLER